MIVPEEIERLCQPGARERFITFPIQRGRAVLQEALQKRSPKIPIAVLKEISPLFGWRFEIE